MAFALFFAGIATLIVVSSSQRMELVTANYYEEELRHQTQIDRTERAQALADRIQVEYDAVGQEIRVRLPVDTGAAAPAGQIHLYRPAAAGLDQVLPLTLDARGLQTIDAKALRPGLWRVRLDWTTAGEEYSIDRRLEIPTRSP